MNIVKSRGGVAAIIATLALASVTAFAQAPAGGPPRGPGMGGPGGMGMGGMMGGVPDKAQTIERQGLNNPALKLSDAQKAQIDKIVDGHVAEQKALAEKYPMTPGSPPSQEARDARMKSRDALTAAIGKVLNDEQRKAWEAARPQGGPGMRGPGGPGMGPGGPPPGR